MLLFTTSLLSSLHSTGIYKFTNKMNDTSVADSLVGKRKRDLASEDDIKCSVCFDFAVDATQTPCCGQIFCKICITMWTNAHSACPICRTTISSSDLLKDIRTERKSANYYRACNYCEQGCPFVGTRNEINQHELKCDFLPKDVLYQRNISLSSELEESKAKLESSKQQITLLKKEKAQILRDSRKAVAKAAWRMPVALSKAKLKLTTVSSFFKKKKEEESNSGESEFYQLKYFNGRQDSYRVRIHVNGSDVSLSLRCHEDAVSKAYTEHVEFVLIHPDGPAKNAITNLKAKFHDGLKKSVKIPQWMKKQEFREFFMSNMFSAGVRDGGGNKDEDDEDSDDDDNDDDDDDDDDDDSDNDIDNDSDDEDDAEDDA